MDDSCTNAMGQRVRDARKQRRDLLKKLEWHQKRIGSKSLAGLIAQLTECRSTQRCRSAVCPECVRAFQRRTVETAQRFDATVKRVQHRRTITLSLVPDFGRTMPSKLGTFDVRSFM